MRSTILILALITPFSATAASHIRVLSDSEIEVLLKSKAETRTELAPRVSEPASVLLLPFYLVDQSNPAGETTLFAVRNTSNATVSVRYRYTQGSTIVLTETLTLAPHATRTVNMRDLVLPISFAGFSAGTLGIAVVNALGSTIFNPVLGGDYFRVDPSGNFASGGQLITAVCLEWHTRFFNGGVFSGGTQFTFIVDNLRNDGAIATAMIYSESGAFRGGFELFSTAGEFEIIDTAAIEAQAPGLLGSFGTIEWTLPDFGVVTQTFTAENRFSVGAAGLCAN